MAFSKKKEKSLIINDETAYSVKEAYNALRTNLLFSLPGTGCKVVGITSATQGNGKSTNTINLAISFAQIGKKVLVIDSDLRLPTVAKLTGAEPRPGLSNVLIGESRLDAALQKCTSYGIWVLPAGSIPPDPTRLLESSVMKTLIDVCKTKFDIVLLDLPPLGGATDALIVSKYVDGFLLMVRHEVSRYRSVSNAIEQLQNISATILGVVYCSAPSSKSKRDNYYYSYYG